MAANKVLNLLVIVRRYISFSFKGNVLISGFRCANSEQAHQPASDTLSRESLATNARIIHGILGRAFGNSDDRDWTLTRTIWTTLFGDKKLSSQNSGSQDSNLNHLMGNEKHDVHTLHNALNGLALAIRCPATDWESVFKFRIGEFDKV